MSVISFPRRVDTHRPPTPTKTPTRRRSHRAHAPRRQAVRRHWGGTSSARKSAVIVTLALTLSLVGSMFEASRQIEIHTLQSQLLQAQSTYAEVVGSTMSLSAPSQIARRAGALHLVAPVSITQIASVALNVPLPLPKFSDYAPVSSRVNR